MGVYMELSIIYDIEISGHGCFQTHYRIEDFDYYNDDYNDSYNDNFIDFDTQDIQFSEFVKLPSLKYCQEFWETGQNQVVIPSKYINSTKKAPISILIAASIMSAKEGGNVNDESGKGARIMNIRMIDKMYQKITDIRNIKIGTINSHIKKLLDIKSQEFEFKIGEDINGKEKFYYRMDYSDGFVLIDLRIIHFMLSYYSNSMIQAYIILLWNCRNGWSQLTREQISQHLGLTKHSDKQARIIMDKLVIDGFVKTKSSYKIIQIVDKVTGIPKSIGKSYYEYKIVNLHEVIEEIQQKSLMINHEVFLLIKIYK